MPNKKINQLNEKTTVNLTDVIPIADPTSGIGEKTEIQDLPFYKGSGTNGYVPYVSDVNTLAVTQIFNDVANARLRIFNPGGLPNDKNGRVTVNSTGFDTGLALNMGGVTLGNGEQHAIEITSYSGYSSLYLKNWGADFNGGLAAIDLQAGNNGQYQVFIGNDGFTRVRPSGKIKFCTGGDIVFGGQTEDIGDEKVRIYSSGGTLIKGQLSLGTVPEYADNAAASTAGLTVGMVYRTGDILKVVHV